MRTFLGYLIGAVIAMLLFSGCGTQIEAVAFQIPSEVEAYYHEFFDVVGYDKQVAGKIEFVETMKNTEEGLFRIGVCYFGVVYYKIQLRRPSWNRMSDNQKRALVYHELTHCTFGIAGHSEDRGHYMYKSNTATLTHEQIDSQLLGIVNNGNHL